MGRGGGHRRGHPVSAATREKLSKALRGKKHPHKGHAVSAATRAKLAAAKKGKKHPHRGHPLTAATRAKLAAARRGKKSPHKGHAISSATRAKIAEALRRRAALRGKKPGPARHPGVTTTRVGIKNRTHRFHSGPHRLLHVGVRHVRKGLLHGLRKHRTRIVIHRRVRAHRVWRHRRKK